LKLPNLHLLNPMQARHSILPDFRNMLSASPKGLSGHYPNEEHCDHSD
jgi:hypothetical protein